MRYANRTLVVARSRITAGELRVARQRKIVEDLESSHHPADHAKALLLIMEESLVSMRESLATLQRDIEPLLKTPPPQRQSTDKTPALPVARYSQLFPKIVSLEGYFSRAHPDAPALPWLGDRGEEICSFAASPTGDHGRITVVLFDAHGREVLRRADGLAILATCLALNTELWEQTFLPTPLMPGGGEIIYHNEPQGGQTR
jgi:hypothetical protein